MGRRNKPSLLQRVGERVIKYEKAYKEYKKNAPTRLAEERKKKLENLDYEIQLARRRKQLSNLFATNSSTNSSSNGVDFGGYDLFGNPVNAKASSGKPLSNNDLLGGYDLMGNPIKRRK
jgi:hypothetical protein